MVVLLGITIGLIHPKSAFSFSSNCIFTRNLFTFIIIISLKSSCMKVRMFNFKTFHPILQCLVFAHKIISCWQNWSISKRFALMDVSIYTALTYLLQTTLDSSFLVPSRRKLNFRPGFQSLRESRKCHKRQLLLTSSFAGKTALLLRESSNFRVSGSNILCNWLGSFHLIPRIGLQQD